MSPPVASMIGKVRNTKGAALQKRVTFGPLEMVDLKRYKYGFIKSYVAITSVIWAFLNTLLHYSTLQ